jgi:hypothetical protein
MVQKNPQFPSSESKSKESMQISQQELCGDQALHEGVGLVDEKILVVTFVLESFSVFISNLTLTEKVIIGHVDCILVFGVFFYVCTAVMRFSFIFQLMLPYVAITTH